MEEKRNMVENNNERLIEMVLFAIVGLIAVAGVLYTLTLFFVVIPAQNLTSQVFNGLISVLMLQVLLVNTVFIWKIMHKADAAFIQLAEGSKRSSGSRK